MEGCVDENRDLHEMPEWGEIRQNKVGQVSRFP